MAREESYGSATGPGEVRLERLLPGPIDRVWRYLTDGTLRGRWFASGEIEPRVGGLVTLVFRHADLSHEKEPPAKYAAYEGHVSHGTVTRWDEPRCFGYAWGDDGEDGEVVFELIPKGHDVLLILTHHKLRSRDAMANVSAGWHSHLGVLIDELEERPHRGFWTAHTRTEAEYAGLFEDAEPWKE